MNKILPPKSSREINFKLPKIHFGELKNGLKILYIQKEKLPLLRLNIVLDAGSKYDLINKKGLSYLTAQLLDEGANGKNALELSDEFDMLGSEFNISLDNDSVFLNLQSLIENADKSLDIISQILQSPDFTEKDFLREKNKQLTKLVQLKDNPDAVANRIFDKVVFEKSDYAYPISGYSNDVQSLSNDDVQSFYDKNYSTYNSFIAAASNLQYDEFLPKLEKYFSNWDSKTESFDYNISDDTAENTIYIFNRPGSVQTEIRAGYKSGKRNIENFFKRVLLNTIFGGQFNSRLNSNLREKNGYTYGIYSQFTYLKLAGYFSISTSVASEITNNALNEILYELIKLKVGVTDEEIDFAKKSTIRRYPLNFETYRQMVVNLSSLGIHSLPLNYFDTFIDNINSVNKDEINFEAIKLSQQALQIVLVGDKKIISENLNQKDFKIIEVDDQGFTI